MKKMNSQVLLLALGSALILAACTGKNEKKISKKEAEAIADSYGQWISAYSQPLPNDCYTDPADQAGSVLKMVDDLFTDFGAELTGTEVTAEKEEEIGDLFHEEIADSGEMTIIDEDPRWKKINKILQEQLPFRERKDIEYHIHLIESEDINAFAIPGGHVYITTALLDFVESDDELAGIIGHEIGHVDLKHCVRKVQKVVTATAFGGDLAALAANFQVQLTAPFGQFDEYASDRTGARLAKQAGYDPVKTMDFFVRLKAGEKYNPLEKLLRTHPYSAQREACLRHYIDHEL